MKDTRMGLELQREEKRNPERFKKPRAHQNWFNVKRNEGEKRKLRCILSGEKKPEKNIRGKMERSVSSPVLTEFVAGPDGSAGAETPENGGRIFIRRENEGKKKNVR